MALGDVSGYAPNLNKLVNQITFDSMTSIQSAFVQAIGEGTTAQTRLIIKALGGSIKNVKYAKAEFTDANYRLARMMQDSMLRSYDQTVTARKEFSSYRANGEGDTQPRFSGGKLRRALSHRDMVVATPQGIAYINNDILDREAKQWARLNYGAGGAAGGGGGAYPWTFRGVTLGALTLPWAPSPAFRMPHGVWIGGRNGSVNDQGLSAGFYPRSSQLNVLTRGIEGRHFFDAGLRRFTQEFPAVYTGVLETFIEQAARGKGPFPPLAVMTEALVV